MRAPGVDGAEAGAFGTTSWCAARAKRMLARMADHVLEHERRAPLGPATLQWAWRGRRGHDIGSMAVGATEIRLGGRHADLRIDGFTRTREVARIQRDGARVWIVASGDERVQVNRVAVARAELHHGDRIEIGPATLTIWST